MTPAQILLLAQYTTDLAYLVTKWAAKINSIANMTDDEVRDELNARKSRRLKDREELEAL